jgi:type IV pilus assembly protein PilW
MANQTLPSRGAGFTLVEILVGMAIAMIGMVMMFQAMSVWEARKRTTASGSDAQVTGSIGMFTLERDLKLAGYGFGNAAAMGCTVNAYDSTRTAPGLFSFPMAPVLITNGDGSVGSTLPDTIAVLYGSGPTMSSSQTYNSITGASLRMNTRTGVRSGDLLIAADAGNAVCGMFEATGNANADGLSIDFANATAYTNYTNNANVATSVAAAALTPAQLAALQSKFINNSGTARFNNGTIQGVTGTGAVLNVGTSPQLNVYRITNRRFLTFTNTLINQTTATEVAEGVIDLQAEYGIDANNDGTLAAAEWTATTPATTAAWGQLRAIRIGLLARSQQFEQINVTAVAPAWAGGAFAMTNLDGTADSTPGNANDWRRYRYRVYETVIPLRNVVWGITN